MGRTAANYGGVDPSKFPLGTRILLLWSVLCEVVFVLRPLSFRSLFHGGAAYTLLVGPFTYGGGLLSLLALVAVGGSRLRKLEYDCGTFGGMLIFGSANAALVVAHVFLCSILHGLGLRMGYLAEFNGAWATLALLYSMDARTDFHEKLFVVGGYPVLVGMMPALVFFTAWSFAWEPPVEVALAILAGIAGGDVLDLPDAVYETLEQAPDVVPQLQFLTNWPSFVQRRNGGFRKLLPKYKTRPQNGVFRFDDSLQPDGMGASSKGGAGMDDVTQAAPEQLLGYTVGNSSSPSYEQSGRPGSYAPYGQQNGVAAQNAPSASFHNVSISAPRGMRPAARTYETVTDVLGGANSNHGAAGHHQASSFGGSGASPVQTQYGQLSSATAGGTGYAGPASRVFSDLPSPTGHMPDMNAGHKDPFDFDF